MEFNPTYNFFLSRLFSERKILSVLFPPYPVKIFPIFSTRLHFVTLGNVNGPVNCVLKATRVRHSHIPERNEYRRAFPWHCNLSHLYVILVFSDWKSLNGSLSKYYIYNLSSPKKKKQEWKIPTNNARLNNDERTWIHQIHQKLLFLIEITNYLLDITRIRHRLSDYRGFHTPRSLNYPKLRSLWDP